jgi:hypothetical protein
MILKESKAVANERVSQTEKKKDVRGMKKEVSEKERK